MHQIQNLPKVTWYFHSYWTTSPRYPPSHCSHTLHCLSSVDMPITSMTILKFYRRCLHSFNHVSQSKKQTLVCILFFKILNHSHNISHGTLHLEILITSYIYIVSAAALSFKNVLDGCSKHLIPHIASLVQVERETAMLRGLKQDDREELIRGVCSVLSSMPQDSDVVPILEGICGPHINEIAAIAQRHSNGIYEYL